MTSVNVFVPLANDKRQVEPMLKALQAQPDCFGKPKTRQVDNGCFSKDNIQTCMDEKIAPLIALGMKTHHLPLAERLVKDETEHETNDAGQKSRKFTAVNFTANAKARSSLCLGSSNSC
ncbi:MULTISPECIES: hypothetical protein [Methylobacter]|jgi:hypothetical protein|uniref:hypothetical protein n=1 Tax=Methylobacter TaxID=429 RepID=UPI0003AA64E0|nr:MULTISPECIES: hypothetical protein [Methylobacter]